MAAKLNALLDFAKIVQLRENIGGCGIQGVQRTAMTKPNCI